MHEPIVTPDVGRLRENLIDLETAIADIFSGPHVFDHHDDDPREAAILDELLQQHAETRAALARHELREVTS